MTDSTRFDLNSIFVACTETPGGHRMAIARLHRKNEKGEELYQMIHRRPPEDELRSPPMAAEDMMKALVKIIDVEIYRRRRGKPTK